MPSAGRHHEVLDVELMAALEEVGQGELALRPIEDIGHFDPNPRQSQALGRDEFAVAGQGLLLFQERSPRPEPFLAGYDLM
jgi:hypothetical protein